MALVVWRAGLCGESAVPGRPGAAKRHRLEHGKGHAGDPLHRTEVRGVWLAIWAPVGSAVGAVLVSEFAPLVSGTLAARQEVATVFLVVFSLAVAAGALAVNALQKGEVSARYVPASALGLAVGCCGCGGAQRASGAGVGRLAGSSWQRPVPMPSSHRWR
jgi:acyl-[acyl-carrier-protein]-phospholipid O-acyltransferase/long-chain-fatty-acid--[acyl-carrier-protein] ligase